jgi:cell division protein FtsZ
MGVGRASGKEKARLAAENAISSPLLETSIAGAKGVIVNITVPPDIALEDVYTASELVSAAAHPDVNLIWGVAYDESLSDEMIITVIATGFECMPEIPQYVFKSPPAEKTAKAFETVPPSAPAAEKKAAAQPAEPPKPVEANEFDDDPFGMILDIFNKKR